MQYTMLFYIEPNPEIKFVSPFIFASKKYRYEEFFFLISEIGNEKKCPLPTPLFQKMFSLKIWS